MRPYATRHSRISASGLSLSRCFRSKPSSSVLLGKVNGTSPSSTTNQVAVLSICWVRASNASRGGGDGASAAGFGFGLSRGEPAGGARSGRSEPESAADKVELVDDAMLPDLPPTRDFK